MFDRRGVETRKAALNTTLDLNWGKVKQAEEALDQAKRDVQAVHGAIMDCDYWLSVLPVNDMPIELTKKEMANGSEAV